MGFCIVACLNGMYLTWGPWPSALSETNHSWCMPTGSSRVVSIRRHWLDVCRTSSFRNGSVENSTTQVRPYSSTLWSLASDCTCLHWNVPREHVRTSMRWHGLSKYAHLQRIYKHRGMDMRRHVVWTSDVVGGVCFYYWCNRLCECCCGCVCTGFRFHCENSSCLASSPDAARELIAWTRFWEMGQGRADPTDFATIECARAR